MKTYMLWFNNAAKGPTTLEKLKELLAAKKISSESLVIESTDFQAETPSDNAWVKLGKVLSETTNHTPVTSSQSEPSRKPSATDSTLQNRNNFNKSDPHESHFKFMMRKLKPLAICIAVVWAILVFVSYVRHSPRPTSDVVVRRFRSPGLSYESKNLRDSWSYQNTNHDVAMALLERSDTEFEIQAKAEFDGDAKNARDHAQRAADYLMAAKVFYSTGKYPPGFDSDLATK